MYFSVHVQVFNYASVKPETIKRCSGFEPLVHTAFTQTNEAKSKGPTRAIERVSIKILVR